MPTLPNGAFSFTISSAELAKGLRPTKRNPRNSKFLVKCEGAVALDGVLQVLDDLNLNLIDTSVITDDFPYPQIFVFTNVIIVFSLTDIYELVGGSLVYKFGPVPSGIEWCAVDLFDFIYAGNGSVAVRRRATDHEWEYASNLPVPRAACNFNGQIVICAPDVVPTTLSPTTFAPTTPAP